MIILHPWALLVAAGIVVGFEVARARGIRLGLDPRDIEAGVAACLIGGFAVGHLVHVFAYRHGHLGAGGFSSIGGFLGAALGSVALYGFARPRPYWERADAIVYGLPFGWTLGRLGCFAAGDHPGRRSESWLAVAYPDGRRHDLGLYEALLAAAIAGAFAALGRRPRPPSFFAAAFALLYAPARFGLDFLRNQDLPGTDPRYAGLTPAQWGCLILLGTGGALALRLRALISEPRSST